MSIGKTIIAVDAMGGENAPYKNLKGVEIFSKNNIGVSFILLGVKEKIENVIESQDIKISNYDIYNTLENIKNDDNASTILRKRKDSSIYQGLKLVRDSKASGFVSAGNNINTNRI